MKSLGLGLLITCILGGQVLARVHSYEHLGHIYVDGSQHGSFHESHENHESHDASDVHYLLSGLALCETLFVLDDIQAESAFNSHHLILQKNGKTLTQAVNVEFKANRRPLPASRSPPMYLRV